MSVKDLIWVTVAQREKIKREVKNKTSELENNVKLVETLYLAICDVREIAGDTNLQTRLLVASKTGQQHISSYDPADLPSHRVEQQRRDAEERARMTPEQLRKKQREDLLAGKTVTV